MTPRMVVMEEEREALWSEFLSSLEPWQLHALTKDETELLAHDSFVAGEATLNDIRLFLSFETEEAQ